MWVQDGSLATTGGGPRQPSEVAVLDISSGKWEGLRKSLDLEVSYLGLAAALPIKWRSGASSQLAWRKWVALSCTAHSPVLARPRPSSAALQTLSGMARSVITLLRKKSGGSFCWAGDLALMPLRVHQSMSQSCSCM